MTQIKTPRDGRWWMLALIAAYAFLVAAPTTLHLASEKQLLQGLGVAALDHPFMDLRGVAAWCEVARGGGDPALQESWIRFPESQERHPNFRMNYSPLVLLLGKAVGLDFSVRSIWIWSLLLTGFYLTSLWYLCGPCTPSVALLWGVLACSPASVLVIERANLDILLFALLALALGMRSHPWKESLCILAAALLKFFPIVALGSVWRGSGNSKKNGRLAVGVTAALFLIFLLLIRSRLTMICSSLSDQSQSSFGCTTIPNLLVSRGVHLANYPSFFLGFKAFALAFLGAALLAGRCLWVQKKTMPLTERSLHAFYLTAPMLLALFLLGPQMDYKWIYFLFLLPAVLELIHSAHHTEEVVAKAWLAVVFGYSWWTFFSDEASLRNALLKQVLMWIAMGLTAFLAGILWKRKTVR